MDIREQHNRKHDRTKRKCPMQILHVLQGSKRRQGTRPAGLQVQKLLTPLLQQRTA